MSLGIYGVGGLSCAIERHLRDIGKIRTRDDYGGTGFANGWGEGSNRGWIIYSQSYIVTACTANIVNLISAAIERNERTFSQVVEGSDYRCRSLIINDGEDRARCRSKSRGECESCASQVNITTRANDNLIIPCGWIGSLQIDLQCVSRT